MQDDYIVIHLSFEAADEWFESLYTLAQGLSRKIERVLRRQGGSDEELRIWEHPISKEFPFDDFGNKISDFCEKSDKKIVLMIDEVDKSSDNQIFVSFLGLLRSKYLEQLQGNESTFHSVISASKYNSPWNIAAEFDLNLNFSADDIQTMLKEYEEDYKTVWI